MTHMVRLSEHEVFANDYVRVFDDSVQFPSGRVGSYVRILDPLERPGVVLIPRHGDAMAVVRTFRYPLGRSQWAFPRGFAQADDPLATGVAELREEIGATASSLTIIGEVTPDSGLLGTRVTVVLADGIAVDDSLETDSDEVETVKWVNRDQLFDLLAADGALDGLSLAALVLFDRFVTSALRGS